jgi:hypothetical protein
MASCLFLVRHPISYPCRGARFISDERRRSPQRQSIGLPQPSGAARPAHHARFRVFPPRKDRHDTRAKQYHHLHLRGLGAPGGGHEAGPLALTPRTP